MRLLNAVRNRRSSRGLDLDQRNSSRSQAAQSVAADTGQRIVSAVGPRRRSIRISLAFATAGGSTTATGTNPSPAAATILPVDGACLKTGLPDASQSDVVGSTPERISAVKNAVREGYLAMLKQARAVGIEVTFATEIPLTEPSGLMNEVRALLGKQSYATRVNAQVPDLNELVRQLAAREKLRLFDFETVLAPDGGARESKYATEDLSHVTAAGFQALTALAIEELGKRR